MHRHPAIGLAAAICLLAGGFAAPARAQADADATAAPAHIAVIDGVAVLERGGRADAAAVNVPLVAGDRLRTERGRLEVLFSDGSTLDLDQDTALDIESDTLLRLLDGRIRLTLQGAETDGSLSLRVDTPAGSADIRAGGEYRVALTGGDGPRQVELKVVRGVASLVTDQGAVGLGAGQRAVASAGAPPSYPYTFNSAAWDAFDNWSDAQREARLGVASSAYLPQDLQPYGGTFDRDGQWRDDPSYGYVWYPSVASGWRPYYHGQWSYVAPYGWTWIGRDAWSWPTHHYGRWGYASGAWFWIPGRRWGPAWVSWLWAPDYVAWCPLGFGGGPLFSAGGFYRAGHAYDPHYEPRHGPYDGWTVLSRRDFGHRGRAVSVYAVTRRTLDRAARQRFGARAAPPPPAGAAAGRAAPVLQAGRRRPTAVARGNGVAVPRPGAAAPRTRILAPRAVQPRASAAPVGLAAAAARARAVPRTSARTIRIIGQPRRVAPAAPAGRTTTRSPARVAVPRDRAVPVNRPFDQRRPSANDGWAGPAPAARTPITGPRGVAPSAPPARGSGITRERPAPYAPGGAPAYGRPGTRPSSPYAPSYGRSPSRAAPYAPAPRGAGAPSAPRVQSRPRADAPAPRTAAPGGAGVRRAAPARPGGGAAPRARTPSGGAPRGGTPRGGSASRGGSSRPAPHGGAVHRTPGGGR